MKNTRLSALIAGTSLLVAAAPAFATTIDGITFPTTSGPHVFAGTINENSVTTPGQELTGNGNILSIDNSTDFCATSGCTLSYSFGGFILDSITQPSGGQQGQANFTGGYVNFYANGDMDNPFLTLEADTEQNSQYTLEGNLTNGGQQAQNTAVGLLSVTGGSAASIFDNNTYANGDGGFSDLLFNTSLSPTGETTFSGSADGHYISPNDVPEPGVLAMLGFGLTLIGVGAAYRRRKDA